MWSPMRTNWPQLGMIHRICPCIHRFLIVGGINGITQSSRVPAAALFSIKNVSFHLNEELRKRRGLYQHQAAFPKPSALETGSDTARFSVNTAPTVYRGSASPRQPLANSVQAPAPAISVRQETAGPCEPTPTPSPQQDEALSA